MPELDKATLRYRELPVSNDVHLRQLESAEANKMFHLVDQNRDYLRYWLPWVDSTHSPSDSQAYILETLKKRQEGSEYGYGIIFEGKPVGHISLMHISDGKDPEIGYWISADVSGKGIVKSAAAALTDFGFTTLELEKIVIKAELDNIASNKVAEKLGYTLQETGTSEHTHRPINIWVKVSDNTA